MTKEVYTLRSLWSALFRPGVPSASRPPALQKVRKEFLPTERPLGSCRNLRLIQRLLEAGNDDTIRRLLFLPNTTTCTQESQTCMTTTETCSQTTTLATDVGSQTPTVPRAAVEVCCQTTPVAADMGSQTPAVPRADADASCQTTPVATDMGSQTPAVPRADADAFCQTTPVAADVGSQTPAVPRADADASCQTTPVATDMGSQTPAVPRADADASCQTTGAVQVSIGMQARPHSTAAASQTSDLQATDAGSQTSGPDHVATGQQTTPCTASAGCQTAPADAVSVVQQTAQQTEDLVEADTNVATASHPIPLLTTPGQTRAQEVLTAHHLMSPRVQTDVNVSPRLAVGCSPTPMDQTENIGQEATVVLRQDSHISSGNPPPLSESTSPTTEEISPHTDSTSPATGEVVPHTETAETTTPPVSHEVALPHDLWAPFVCLEKQVAHDLPPDISLPAGVRIIPAGDLDLKLSDPTKVHVIAAGGYGEVFPVRDVFWHAEFPLLCKHIRGTDASVQNSLQKEAAILQHLYHTGVVPRLYGVVQKTAYLPDNNIVMEHISGGWELFDLVKKNAGLSINLWIDILIQVAKAMKSIHAAGVLHNDIKSDNVIVTQPTPATVKAHLIDFGLASFGPCTPWRDLDPSIPKPSYMAPEVYDGTLTSPASDVYAFGEIIDQVNYSVSLDHLSQIRDACMDYKPDNRPSIDVTINFLKFIQNTL